MKRIEYIVYIVLIVSIAFIIIDAIEDSKQAEAYKLRQKELRLEIEQYHLQESKKEKYIQYWMTKYNQAKDSLAIERKNVKIKYIEYKQPVKVDLSTDAKRDSVIEKLIQ